MSRLCEDVAPLLQAELAVLVLVGLLKGFIFSYAVLAERARVMPP